MFQTIQVDEPIEDDDVDREPKDKDSVDEDADTKVEEEKTEDKPKTKKVDKTVWDWEVLNDSKPIWTRKYENVDICKRNESLFLLSH